jgi:hypothetical protein
MVHPNSGVPEFATLSAQVKPAGNALNNRAFDKYDSPMAALLPRDEQIDRHRYQLSP